MLSEINVNSHQDFLCTIENLGFRAEAKQLIVKSPSITIANVLQMRPFWHILSTKLTFQLMVLLEDRYQDVKHAKQGKKALSQSILTCFHISLDEGSWGHHYHYESFSGNKDLLTSY